MSRHSHVVTSGARGPAVRGKCDKRNVAKLIDDALLDDVVQDVNFAPHRRRARRNRLALLVGKVRAQDLEHFAEAGAFDNVERAVVDRNPLCQSLDDAILHIVGHRSCRHQAVLLLDNAVLGFEMQGHRRRLYSNKNVSTRLRAGCPSLR